MCAARVGFTAGAAGEISAPDLGVRHDRGRPRSEAGAGMDFVRVFSEPMVGSALDAKFEMRNGIPTIFKAGKLILVDDRVGKPIGVYRHIGRLGAGMTAPSELVVRGLLSQSKRKGPDYTDAQGVPSSPLSTLEGRLTSTTVIDSWGNDG